VIGRQLAHFEILEEIGAGGMGRVYLARDRSLGRLVALKTLGDEVAGPEYRKRLLAEAQAASSLSHPSIVTIYQVGSEDGVDFIAMERVVGRPLAQVIREEGPLGEEQVRRIALELAEALAVAHRAGVIHRDLKPGNVMVTPDGRVKVLDFGLAKRVAVPEDSMSEELPTLSQITRDGSILGTPPYMAPEQIQGRPVGPRTDLFALGATLYEMLTGERPFPGTRAIEVLSAVLRETPTPPSQRREGLSSAWDPLVSRLLEKEPENRFADAEEVAAELRRLGGPRRGAAMTRIASLIAAVALTVGLLAGTFLFRDGAENEDAGAAGSEVMPAALSGDTFPGFAFRLLLDRPGSQREPSLSPDGGEVAFVEEDEEGVPQLWALEVATGEVRQLTRGGVPSRRPRWSRDGDRIIFESPGQGIWAISPAGGEPHRLLREGASPSLSPDGSLLSFVHDRRPWIANGDGSDPRPLPGFERLFFGNLAYPAFSPTGEEIVTFWPHPERPLGDLWIAPVNGRDPPRRLTFLELLPWDLVPVWSADGEWILFTSDHGGSVNLWRISPAGGEAVPVTVGAGNDLHPDLSLDQGRLIYAAGRNRTELRLLGPGAGTPRVAFQRRQPMITPELSPDGQRATFFARAPGGFHLFVLEPATGELRQVTEGEGLMTHPRWAPDGATLYFYQAAPEYALRRVPVAGGAPETVVPGWRWPEHNGVQVSPDGELLVYSLRDGGRLVEARVRRLASGEEWSLGLPLYQPRWSADGGAVYGATWRPGVVHGCSVEPVACRRITDGWEVRPGPRGESLYVLRGSPPAVWRHDLASGAEELLLQVSDYDGTDFGWGVTPDGGLIYHAHVQGEIELWLGEAIP
jgi:eukaryotic-like serine/threonine-protein kinase